MFGRKKQDSDGENDLFSRELTKLERRPGDLFTYEIDPGRIYSRIFVSEEDSSIRYELVEPYLNEVMVRIVEDLKRKTVKLISDTSESRRDEPDIELFINRAISSSTLEEQGKRIAYYYLQRDFLGFGPIDALLKDPGIEDITCDGSSVPVYVYHSSYGFIATNVGFPNDEVLNSYIKKLVQSTGKNISISSPLVDSIMADGSRLQASLGRYVTTSGPSFTIRKFKHVPLSPVDLILNGTADAEIFSYLWILTEYGSNIMITGGTASGKTTFLNSILLFAPPEKKIVSIEDTNEINLYHENWLSTVTRAGFNTAAERKRTGEVDMFDLLVASLRHRPDYVVIGEVRGRETFTVFQAMSVGRYSYCTFHADGVDTLIHRIESNPINVPRTLISSLDTVIVLSTLQRNGVQRRLVSTVSEINDLDQISGELIVNRLYSWDNESFSYDSSEFSYVLERISDRTGQPLEELEKELEVRKGLLGALIERGISRYDEVAAIVRRYHRDRDSVVKEYLTH